MKVLIVDDVEEMRELIRHVIDGMKEFEVGALAGSGPEARMEVGRNRPDLILLDEVLPGESAIDCLKEWSSDGIPVILITGVENPTHEIPREARGRLWKPTWETVDKDRSQMEAKMLQMVHK